MRTSFPIRNSKTEYRLNDSGNSLVFCSVRRTCQFILAVFSQVLELLKQQLDDTCLLQSGSEVDLRLILTTTL